MGDGGQVVFLFSCTTSFRVTIATLIVDFNIEASIPMFYFTRKEKHKDPSIVQCTAR